MFKPLPDQPDYETSGDRSPQATLFMPARNRLDYVSDALRSALDQTGIVLEILILDDASEDDTPSLILNTLQQHTRHPHTVKFWRGRTRRANDVTATLIDKASCDFCIAQHDDDISLPNRAQRLYQTHLETGATVLATDFNPITSNGSNEPAEERPQFSGFITPQTLIESQGDYVVGATFAFNYRELRQFPRLDTSYLNFPQDRFTAFRGTLLGGYYHLPEILIKYRRHQGQWSARMADFKNTGTSACS